MDIKRDPPKKTKRNILIAGGVIAIVATTVALSNLEARPQGVPRAELWIDSVVRGPFVRQVRAPGTLVPEQMRYVVKKNYAVKVKRWTKPGGLEGMDEEWIDHHNLNCLL